MLELILGILGLLIAVATLLFTEQGREIAENCGYYFRRFAGVFPRRLRHRALPPPREEGDRSSFVTDITVPDGAKVVVNSRFAKTWEIRNIGTVVWKDRYIQRQGLNDGPGRLKSPFRVRIPYTKPGQTCRVTVRLTAPPLPGSCYAEWKMVDHEGRVLLPNQKAVYVAVDVVEKL
jgi:hypothetical protein